MVLISQSSQATLEEAEQLARQVEDETIQDTLSRLTEIIRDCEAEAAWRERERQGQLQRGASPVYLLPESPRPPIPAGEGACDLAPEDPVSDLIQEWREEAEPLRRYGADSLAQAAEQHAEQLEAALDARQLNTVTLEEAAELGGYSYSHLQRLVDDGTIPNAGRKGAPRIFWKDVPRKPGHKAGEQQGSRTKLEILEASLETHRAESA